MPEFLQKPGEEPDARYWERGNMFYYTTPEPSATELMFETHAMETFCLKGPNPVHGIFAGNVAFKLKDKYHGELVRGGGGICVNECKGEIEV